MIKSIQMGSKLARFGCTDYCPDFIRVSEQYVRIVSLMYIDEYDTPRIGISLSHDLLFQQKHHRNIKSHNNVTPSASLSSGSNTYNVPQSSRMLMTVSFLSVSLLFPCLSLTHFVVAGLFHFSPSLYLLFSCLSLIHIDDYV
jgi:hypothetical protein